MQRLLKDAKILSNLQGLPQLVPIFSGEAGVHGELLNRITEPACRQAGVQVSDTTDDDDGYKSW
jgi:hypothetical protein